MIRQVIHPKNRISKSLPSDLCDFLAHVSELICIDDEVATQPSDDLLQCDFCYGGLKQANSQIYSFTYFPNHNLDTKWLLQISLHEINDIASGVIQSLPLFSCSDTHRENLFSNDDTACSRCDYIDDPDFGRFKPRDGIDKLEQLGYRGISPNCEPKDVIAIMGDPSASHEGGTHHGMRIFPWIKYHLKDYQIRFEFNTDLNRIREINFMDPDWVPGK